MQALFAHILNQSEIETLQSNRLVGHNFRHVVSSTEGIGKTKHQERTRGRAIYEVYCGLQYGNAGAFSTDKRSCYVKAIFWQQLIQIIARNTTWNIWETLANQISVGVS